MLGDRQLLQGVVCGDTALKSQSLVSTQLHGISSKAHAGTEQTWVPHPSELLAILMPITGARCHLEQAFIGRLCFVSCLWYHLFQLFNTAPSPCAALLGLSGCQCPALYHQRGLGAPRQTVGTECLLCHHLQLLPARPQSPGCAGPVLGHPSSPSSPGQCCWPQPWPRGATRGAGHCRRH